MPRIETTVELADDDRTCPACRGDLEAVTGMTEDAEMIDVIERRFIRRIVKRQKYRCRCNGRAHGVLAGTTDPSEVIREEALH